MTGELDALERGSLLSIGIEPHMMIESDSRGEDVTTINTVEQFMAELDADPALLEAVRARLLTRELLDLPHTLRRYMEKTDQRIEALEIATNRRIASLETTLKQYIEATERRLDSVQSDIGDLKGFHARSVFCRRAMFLVQRSMGYRVKSRLSDDDLLDILSDADTTGIEEEDMLSFEDADALLRVEDSGGADHYVAVEVSYTVHTDDVSRAARNAEYLTRWTGIPAQSAVAGVELHDSAWRASRDSGTTFLRIQNRLLRPS